MSSWRLARVVGAGATVSICISSIAHGSGTGTAKAPLRSVAHVAKILESLADSSSVRSGAAASVYAKPEGTSPDRNRFDKLKPKELAADEAASNWLV